MSYDDELAYQKTGEDDYADPYEVTVDSYGYLMLTLTDSSPEPQTPGVARAIHTYSPEQARKLAKRLRKAADIAEEL